MSLNQNRKATSIIGAMLLVCGTTTGVFAQGQNHEEEKAKNLKVLDSALSHDQLIDIMGSYTTALGVHCDFCHARSADPNRRDMDWASDKVPAKEITRQMIKMMRGINGDYLGAIQGLDTPRVKVECVTCHRGQERPMLIDDVLNRALASGGMKTVDSVYRALRGEYYGSATYDFSEAVLVHFAWDIAQENDTVALQALALNREFNPKSSFTEWATGQIYAERGDTVSAIASLEKALEYNPNNRRAKRDLDQLKGVAPKKP